MDRATQSDGPQGSYAEEVGRDSGTGLYSGHRLGNIDIVDGGDRPQDFVRNWLVGLMRATESKVQRRRRKSAERARRYYRQQQNALKVAARRAVGSAIRSRRLAKKPCESCGIPETEAHHEDYSKPLDVQWYCRKCHSKRHPQKRGAA